MHVNFVSRQGGGLWMKQEIVEANAFRLKNQVAMTVLVSQCSSLIILTTCRQVIAMKVLSLVQFNDYSKYL